MRDWRRCLGSTPLRSTTVRASWDGVNYEHFIYGSEPEIVLSFLTIARDLALPPPPDPLRWLASTTCSRSESLLRIAGYRLATCPRDGGYPIRGSSLRRECVLEHVPTRVCICSITIGTACRVRQTLSTDCTVCIQDGKGPAHYWSVRSARVADP